MTVARSRNAWWSRECGALNGLTGLTGIAWRNLKDRRRRYSKRSKPCWVTRRKRATLPLCITTMTCRGMNRKGMQLDELSPEDKARRPRLRVRSVERHHEAGRGGEAR